jgi:hypothetical protein
VRLRGLWTVTNNAYDSRKAERNEKKHRCFLLPPVGTSNFSEKNEIKQAKTYKRKYFSAVLGILFTK